MLVAIVCVDFVVYKRKLRTSARNRFVAVNKALSRIFVGIVRAAERVGHCFVENLVDKVDNGLRRAEVVRERDVSISAVRHRRLEVPRTAPPKSVNGLLYVAHYKHFRTRVLKLLRNARLQRVYVLKLVDKHVFDAVRDFAHTVGIFEHAQRAVFQIRIIGFARLLFALAVAVERVQRDGAKRARIRRGVDRFCFCRLVVSRAKLFTLRFQRFKPLVQNIARVALRAKTRRRNVVDLAVYVIDEFARYDGVLAHARAVKLAFE